LLKSDAPIYEHPADLLQNLIRFNTTNPPGNERPCIEYINGLLKTAGFETTLLAHTPERPNLITRLKGEGKAPPLLLFGHVDVVTTEGQQWIYPPFEGRIEDGYIWGRGALDMKHGLTMYLSAILKAKAEGICLPGDIIFAALVDEEAGSENGAIFLVEHHPDIFREVHFALSEFGGSNLTMAGKRFYPIQTSEKQVCPARITFRGTGGHAAVPRKGGAMAKLAAALITLDRHPLPVHISPHVRLMFEGIAEGLGGFAGTLTRQLLNPLLTNLLLKAAGTKGAIFSSLLHNSVSPTILKASDKINVIPSEVTLELDGRVLPGFAAADLERELRNLLGKDCTIEATLPHPGFASTNMDLFETLATSLRELDPAGIPIPFVNFAVTDARFFSKLGIQTYGYTPVQIPEGLDLTDTIHAANERVPVRALEFGTQAVFSVIRNFH
jgi:acetylornithine deacetylase/succinyl-diaminopimelate desuccinylase-like protein